MKTIKTILLLIYFTSFIQNSVAQSSSNFGINIGVSNVTSNISNIYFAFVDESPSQDRIETQFGVENKYNPIMVSPFYSSTFDNNVEFNIKLDVGFSTDLRVFGSHLGLLKKFEVIEGSGLDIGIGADLSLSGAKVYLGNIHQNDLYIRINGEDFYGSFLRTHYKERQVSINPQLRVSKVINENFSILCNAGYRVPFLSFNGNVIFQGTDTDIENGSYAQTVSLRNQNIALYVDGEEKNKNLFTQKGLFAEIGISFNLN